MAITAGEMVTLEPGDVVRVISQEEREKILDNDLFVFDWGSGMDMYCGQELTVRTVCQSETKSYIYVEGNSYYWLPEFIDCIVCSSSKIEALSEDSLMGLLFPQRRGGSYV